MKIINYFLCLLLCTYFVLGVSGEIDFIGVYKDANCQNLLSNNNITAGDTASVKVRLTNTGSDDIINSELFVGSYFVSGTTKNYDKYSYGTKFFDIDSGSSIDVCYSFTLTANAKPTQWTGRIIFRSNTQVNFVNSPYFFYFNVTNTTAAWNEIQVTQNPPGTIKTDVGNTASYSLIVKNLNPSNNFVGVISLPKQEHNFSDGTNTKSINLNPNSEITYDVITTAPTFEGQEIILAHHIDSGDQQIFRDWPRLKANGKKYMYQVLSLVPNQTFYKPNEKGFFTAEIKNIGDNGANWVPNNFSYNFLLRAKDSGGTYQTLLNQTVPHNGGAVTKNEIITLVSPEFTNTFSNTITDMTLEVSVLKDNNEIQVSWQGNDAVYNSDLYSDITSSCTNTTIISSNDVKIIFNCQANGNSVFFVKGVNGVLESVTNTSGSMNHYWLGTYNDVSGVFISGGSNSIYDITWLLTQGIELSALSFNNIFFFCIFFIFIYFRYGVNNK